MGMMFGLVGLMMAVYGLFTRGSKIYDEHSLGINVNLYWGVALAGFGLLMLGIARWSAAVEAKKKETGDAREKAEKRFRGS
jgi:hypothetical protein